MSLARAHRSLQIWPLALALLMVGCDYNISLQHGYFVARVYAGAFVVVAPDRRVVTPISRSGMSIAVVGTLILGQTDPSEDDLAHDAPASHFFIVNTTSGRAWTHLSIAEYRRLLFEMGATKLPRLRRANRFMTLSILQSAG